jgi:hypothetical protein
VNVQGAEKAAQDLLEGLFLPYEASTDRGNQMFDPTGNPVALVISQSLGAPTIRANIQQATQRVMRLQQNSSTTDPEEVIQSIDQILVRQVDGDPTSYAFLETITVNDQSIGLARAISMGQNGPTPYPLVGGSDP